MWKPSEWEKSKISKMICNKIKKITFSLLKKHDKSIKKKGGLD